MNTSVSIYHPSVLLLKNAVEGVFLIKQASALRPRTTLKTPADFEALSVNMNHRLSADSLRRFFGYKRGYETIRLSTLNILSIYVGYENWSDFISNCQYSDHVESVIDTDGFDLCSDAIPVGGIVELRWLPDRVCTMKYSGNSKFEVTSVKNSLTLAKGDILCFRTVKVGRSLRVDNVIHGGVFYPFVILGKINGIVSVKLLPVP